jgi:hypothetical protein
MLLQSLQLEMKKEKQTYSQLERVFNKVNCSKYIIAILSANDNLSISKKISIYNK